MSNDETVKTYLVTGGVGFIGTNFVKHLVGKYGDKVNIVVLDALTYAGNMANIETELQRPGVSFVHGDIRDESVVTAVMERHDPDYVVNFAAESHVDRSVTGPRVFVETNVLGTQVLLDAARNAWRSADGGWRPGKRFLQISTDEVYGSLSRDYDSPRSIDIPDDVRAVMTARTDTPKAFGREFFTEETSLRPRSPYSASKAAADQLTAAYGHTYGMPVLVTRCSNNYGPWQFPEKLIPLMINNIVEGRALPVYGKGLNVRDWLYVDDHCSAIDTVLRRGTPGQAYNVGGFNEQANIDIVNTIINAVARLTGTEPRTDLLTFVKDRPGHDMRYAIDPQNIVRQLGWYPAIPFDRGIEMTVRWNLENRQWIENIVNGSYRNYYQQQYNTISPK